MRVLVTGGAGFIGSALVRYLVSEVCADVLTVDKLTYAGNLASLKPIENAPNHRFLQADICDRAAMNEAFAAFQPDYVMHLAAESHVDRSITGAADFIQTNINGTFTMLEASILERPCGRRQGEFPHAPRVNRRGLWLTRGQRLV